MVSTKPRFGACVRIETETIEPQAGNIYDFRHFRTERGIYAPTFFGRIFHVRHSFPFIEFWPDAAREHCRRHPGRPGERPTSRGHNHYERDHRRGAHALIEHQGEY